MVAPRLPPPTRPVLGKPGLPDTEGRGPRGGAAAGRRTTLRVTWRRADQTDHSRQNKHRVSPDELGVRAWAQAEGRSLRHIGFDNQFVVAHRHAGPKATPHSKQLPLLAPSGTQLGGPSSGFGQHGHTHEPVVGIRPLAQQSAFSSARPEFELLRLRLAQHRRLRHPASP